MGGFLSMESLELGKEDFFSVLLFRLAKLSWFHERVLNRRGISANKE